MKSMTKLMVVAMLVVAALVVAPAAARTVAVDNGSTVYVGEKNLNFGGFAPGAVTNIQYVHLSGSFDDWNVDNTILADRDSGNVTELTKSAVGTKTGIYYVTAVKGGSAVKDKNMYVNIQYPDVNLDVVLNKSRDDSVDGKTVTRGDELLFKLTNNLVGYPDAKMNIEVTLPGGGTTTQFGDEKLREVPVNSTIVLTKPISLEKAESGKYTAIAKWPSGTDFYGKGFDSDAVNFEILTKKLAISSNKDSVVRGNSFTVTITGESAKIYRLFIEKVGGLDVDEGDYPMIVDGQNGLQDLNTTAGESGIDREVKTTAGGTRSIQFNTTTGTDDRQFTIRVEDPEKTTTYDEVKVKVEEGDVTITASGTGVYYIGEEITLSGTCTDNETVYLFLTGPNLGTDGVMLTDIRSDVENNNATTFTSEDVEADDTWSLKWNTGDIGKSLDAGGYTIYAVSKPKDKKHLSEAKYATASIQLKTGFITATSSGAAVAKGDDLKLTGTAQGDPQNVYVWIFGKNYYGVDNNVLAASATVESDGSFEYKLKNTRDLSAGQYFVIIQHPMMDKKQGVWAKDGKLYRLGANETTPVFEADLLNLPASDAATALINALDSPNVDDTYTKLTFVVEEPKIFIDAIGDKEAGSKFTISGTTNLAVGDKLIIDVTSSAFQPSKKTETSGFGSSAGTATVEKSDGMNKWSFEVDATGFKPDQYIVKIESVETGTTETANFNVVEPKPTTQPTTVTTTQPAGTETTATTTGTTTTPTQSPGFGALVALAGLGAVAFLVLRRN